MVFDSSTWRSTSQELIQNPAVQHQTSQYVVDQLYNSSSVESQVAAALPPQLQPFAPAVTSGLHNVAIDAGNRLLATTPVQQLFVEASVKAHDEFVRLINDQTKFAKIDNNKIVLDLHPVLIEIANKAGAGAQAQRLLPPTAGQLDIMNANQLSTVQTVVRILHALSIWAAFICVVLFALAVWLAHGYRRRALLWSAIGILIATFALIFVRRELGSLIINALVGNVSVRPALITAWYIGTNVIGTINLTLLIIALVLVIGLWLAGPGRSSTAVRRRLAPWITNPWYAFGIPAVIRSAGGLGTAAGLREAVSRARHGGARRDRHRGAAPPDDRRAGGDAADLLATAPSPVIRADLRTTSPRLPATATAVLRHGRCLSICGAPSPSSRASVRGLDCRCGKGCATLPLTPARKNLQTMLFPMRDFPNSGNRENRMDRAISAWREQRRMGRDSGPVWGKGFPSARQKGVQ